MKKLDMKKVDFKGALGTLMNVAVPLGAAVVAFMNAQRQQKEKEEYEKLKEIVFGKENK